MKKIIFCDKNEKLVEEVKKLFKNEINNTHCELIISEFDDIFKTKKKYNKAKIITASNPNFSMSGGLDLQLKNKYPEQCNNLREFGFEKDLFFTISVDENFKATEYWMIRAMFGAYMCSRKNDIIISGLGTGIGGLGIEKFLIYLKRFINADFRYADLSSADFSSADFRYASFRYANFRSADFSYTNFSSADFRYADFRYADLRSTDFRYADFSSADFSYKITPQDCKFIGWKSASNKILKLEIQDWKKVSGGLVGRKLRTNKVKVLEIQEINGKKSDLNEIKSDYDSNFIYKLGKIIEEKEYEHTDLEECKKGIHFFITREEAVDYNSK